MPLLNILIEGSTLARGFDGQGCWRGFLFISAVARRRLLSEIQQLRGALTGFGLKHLALGWIRVRTGTMEERKGCRASLGDHK